ncbi:MAG: extracellular solute-binding protein, partial [Oscillospiraceae bacterium]|nr:extracellular solute-binding protein [Oscillospiraceae bacterium]
PPTPTPEPPVEIPEPDPTLEGNITLGWWGNPTRNAQTTAVITMFNEFFPDIAVEELTVGWGDYWTMLGTLAASGDLPDVVQMDISTLEEYVQNAQLLDLTPLIESGQIDLTNVPPAVIELGRVGTGIYALSIGQNSPAMIYNATLMEELGIDVPYNITIDQFVEISRQVYAERGIRTNFALSDPSNPLEFLVRGDGLNMWQNPTPEMFLPWFELIAQAADEGWGYDPAHFIGRAGVVDQDPMVAGGAPNTQSWVTFGWSNGITGLQNAAPEGMVLAMAHYPSHNPALSNYVRASMYFSIAANSANVDAAAAFISFWTNSVAAHTVMLGERGVPASAAVVDAIAPNLSPVAQIMFDFVSLVQDAATVPYALRPAAAGEINSQLRLLVDEVAAGIRTPAEAADTFAAFASNLL